jgi:SAM-dependent methyltransferase
MSDPKLYSDLADWWPLLSPPSDYEEEAAIYVAALRAACDQTPRSLLELGSGGGNNASHMKRRFEEVVLVDRSPGMLAVSRALNPECEHLQGDMRSVRLGRQFDCVFVHDAICYITSEEDLRRVADTAYAHCRPGGAALFAPDYVRENFRVGTEEGGHDGDGRALRYLEWTWDADPTDSVYTVDYAYLLREGDGSVRVVHDRHEEGIFPRAAWMRSLTDAGFEPEALTIHHEAIGVHSDCFVARRRR